MVPREQGVVVAESKKKATCQFPLASTPAGSGEKKGWHGGGFTWRQRLKGSYIVRRERGVLVTESRKGKKNKMIMIFRVRFRTYLSSQHQHGTVQPSGGSRARREDAYIHTYMHTYIHIHA